MKEVHDFLKAAKTYYLATVEGDKPHVRPFGTIDIFDGKLYIQTGKSKKVSEQMLANPNIEISAMNGEKWIRIEAEAVLDDNIRAQEHMMENYPELRPLYTPGDGNTEVFYLKNVTAQICSFTEAPRTITF